MFKRLLLILSFVVATPVLADGQPLAGDEVIKTIGAPRNTLIVNDISSFVLGSPFVATGGTAPRTLADRAADLINVKDFGAKCDGSTDDSAAFQAAANLGQAISVPAGICRINTTINVVTGTQFRGQGRPGQYIFAPTNGTTLDFITAPAGSDGFANTGTVQMVYFSDLQVERAPRHGFNLTAVYAGFDRVSSAYNGGDGVHLTNTYLSKISNSFFEQNTGGGLSDTGSSEYTTLDVSSSEADHNGGDGWQITNVNSSAFIATGADHNGGYGYSAFRTNTNISSLGFYSTDSESNGKSGYYFNHATVTMTSSTGAVNNSSATAGEANFVLADQGSTVKVDGSYDLAPTTANSINAINTSIISGQNNTWLAAQAADGTSHISTLGAGITILPTTGMISFNVSNPAGTYALYGDIGNTILNAPSSALISFRINNVTKATLSAAGVFGVVGSTMSIATSHTPATSAEACTQGAINWDANFVYVCIATNTWRRSTLAAF